VPVSTIPHFLRNRTVIVQVHTHTLLLRALASENVSRHRLFNLCLSQEHFLLGLGIASLNLNDFATRHHTNMLQFNFNGIVGQHHAYK